MQNMIATSFSFSLGSVMKNLCFKIFSSFLDKINVKSFLFCRLNWLVALSAALLIILSILAPHQIVVALYKINLITISALVGYWIDRTIFPYARPDGYLIYDWRQQKQKLSHCGTDEQVDFSVVKDHQLAFSAAMLRRALIMIAVVLGVALGL